MNSLSTNTKKVENKSQGFTPSVVVNITEWVDGEVKWFNKDRGFGFITRGPKIPDIFIHFEIVKMCGLTDLKENQKVRVRYGRDVNKRLRATEIKLSKR